MDILTQQYLNKSNPQSLIDLIVARKSLAVYGKLTRNLTPQPHHNGVIKAVQPDTWNKGACVVCPPGSGKSTWISEIAPSWFIGNNPDKFILHLHANDDKSDSYLKVVMQTFEGNQAHRDIFPDVLPDYDRGWSGKGLYFKWKDKTGKHPLRDEHGWAHLPNKDPQYVSIGFWGGSIGRRADIIILDDPFDPADVDSPVFRAKFLRRFNMVIKTRLKPRGRIIFVCNRWHHDDMVPHLEEMGFQIVTFPAISVDHDGNEQSYWETMFPIAELQDYRKDLGTIDFNCLYQGDPSGVEGAIIKRAWFKYFKLVDGYLHIHDPVLPIEIIPLSSLRLFQAVDPAASIRTTADYFAIATVGVDKRGRFFVLDMIRKRLQGPDQPALMRNAYDQWHPYAQGVEKVGYQLTLVQYANELGLPIKELPRFGDKLSRHLTLAARYQAGRIYHRVNVSWLGDMEVELTQIPKSAHDDQADVLADAMEELSSSVPRVTAIQLAQVNRSHGRSFLGRKF